MHVQYKRKCNIKCLLMEVNPIFKGVQSGLWAKILSRTLLLKRDCYGQDITMQCYCWGSCLVQLLKDESHRIGWKCLFTSHWNTKSSLSSAAVWGHQSEKPNTAWDRFSQTHGRQTFTSKHNMQAQQESVYHHQCRIKQVQASEDTLQLHGVTIAFWLHLRALMLRSGGFPSRVWRQIVCFSCFRSVHTHHPPTSSVDMSSLVQRQALLLYWK